MKAIQYLKTPDGYSSYKVNHECRKITRICNNRRSFPSYEDLDEMIADEKLIKLRKDVWRQIENSFFTNNEFNWMHEGTHYKTSDKPFPEFQLNKNPDEKSCYPLLVFHNGEVWATVISGNYFPQMQLRRVDRNGQDRTKWTNVKNVRNFEKE